MNGRTTWPRASSPARPAELLRRKLVAMVPAAIILLSAATAEAQVHRAVIRSYRPEGLPCYCTHDIFVDFSGQYTGSQMIIELTSGEIYQEPNLGRVRHMPPPSFLLTLFPNLQWDTFVANGGPTAEDTIGSVGIAGAAINVAPIHNGQGPQRPYVFSDSAIDIAWFAHVENNFIEDEDDFMVARVTLSDDANGTLRFLASANQVIGVAEFVTPSGLVLRGGEAGVTLPIINGLGICIPEPSMRVLLCIGIVGIAVLKCRRA